MTRATPFLMFQHGHARPAMEFYAATVPDTRILQLEAFDETGPGPAGTVKRAVIEIAGQTVMVHDSFITHGFDFTPSFSLFLDCDDEAQFDVLFAALSSDGAVLMPPGNYGWSRKFGWLTDRFGVSWQLDCA